MNLSNAELKYHFHPEKGWLNDPNGLSYFNGQYHIFYQHLPDSEYPDGSKMHWGHAVTKDFLNYRELPTAIDPDTPYDMGGIWSGTAIEKDGMLFAFYASIDENGRQTISVAYSEDGISFEKYPGNPVIADYPSFVKCGDGYLLSVSVCPNKEKHYFEVLYGSFDGKDFKTETVSHFQKGPDEYAGQIFGAPDSRSILISWIPGWDYQPKEKCIGCLSLPLEISVSNGKITAYPVNEVQCLLSEDDTLTDAYIKEEFINHGETVIIKLCK